MVTQPSGKRRPTDYAKRSGHSETIIAYETIYTITFMLIPAAARAIGLEYFCVPHQMNYDHVASTPMLYLTQRESSWMLIVLGMDDIADACKHFLPGLATILDEEDLAHADVLWCVDNGMRAIIFIMLLIGGLPFN